ncbi:hypothetical protein CBS101457_004872 [Exobasidium rhododendri]|nr:hypothetical protein CBS101457_004872 [Exobasidium rhododendri]
MVDSPRDSLRDDDLFLPHTSFSSASPSTFSLAQHYIPDKIALHATGWGSEARKASRAAAGGWGAAASSKRKGNKSNSSSVSTDTFKGNGVLFKPELYREATGSLGFSSSISSPYSNNSIGPSPTLIGPPSSGHRNRKWGAGRDAWGKDGGGNPALGAGSFEDDDGLDLSPSDLPRTSDAGLNEEQGSEAASNSTAALLRKKTSLLSRMFGARIPQSAKRARWNRFKWCFVIMNALLTMYALVGFVVLLLVWAGMYKETKVLDLVNKTEMILAMTAMTLCVITAIFGWAGLMLNNRAFLSIYTLLLWISFIFIVAPGYIAYKKRTFNLSGKMNQVWSRALSISARRTVQVTLECCGYYSPFIEAAADSDRCYARSILPGCKGPLIDFQRRVLQYIYICSFAIVPVHLALIVTALLCADHITYRFGKGVTPKEYRIDENTIRQALSFQHSLSPSQSHDGSLQKMDKTLSIPRPLFWQNKSASSSATAGIGKI